MRAGFLYLCIFEYILSLSQFVQSLIHESKNSSDKYWRYKTLWKPYEDTVDYKKILSDFLSTMSELESIRTTVVTVSNYIDPFFMNDYYANMFSQNNTPKGTTRFRKREQVITRFPYRYRPTKLSNRRISHLPNLHTEITNNNENEVNFEESYWYEDYFPIQYTLKDIPLQLTSIIKYSTHRFIYRPQFEINSIQNYGTPMFRPVISKTNQSFILVQNTDKTKTRNRFTFPPTRSLKPTKLNIGKGGLLDITEDVDYPTLKRNNVIHSFMDGYTTTIDTWTFPSTTLLTTEDTDYLRKKKPNWPPFSESTTPKKDYSETSTTTRKLSNFPLTTPYTSEDTDYPTKKKIKYPGWPPIGDPTTTKKDYSKTSTTTRKLSNFPLTTLFTTEDTDYPTKKKKKYPGWPPIGDPTTTKKDYSETSTKTRKLSNFPLTTPFTTEDTNYSPTNIQKTTTAPWPLFSNPDTTENDYSEISTLTTKDHSSSTSSSFLYSKDDVKAYCYMCGLNETGIPRAPTCYHVFDNTEISAKNSRRNYKVHCLKKTSFKRSNKNVFVGDLYRGGCFKRFTDAGMVYNERGCRTMKPTKGMSFASNRFVKMELLLADQDEGCVVSPHASLTPFSRAISLFVRYHVCVCKGRYCNQGTHLSEAPLATIHLISIIHILYFVPS